MSDETRPENASQDDRASLNPIEQVRDILFGEQVREFEGRTSELEALIQSELTALREEYDGKLADLEQAMREELRALAARRDADLRERAALDTDLAARFQGLAERFGASASAGDATQAHDNGRLRGSEPAATREDA